MIVPSWLRGPRGAPVRDGASRSASRISRSTRRREVRTPPWRRRAQTLRWPSPWKGLAASTARIASSSSASGIGPAGPGRRGAAARGGSRWRQTVERATPQTRQTRASPYGPPTDSEVVRLIASTSFGPKGGRPPGRRPSRPAARARAPSRRASPSAGRPPGPWRRPAWSRAPPRRRPGRRHASPRAWPPSPPARARPSPGPRRAGAAARLPACAAGTSVRPGRVRPHPHPSSPSSRSTSAADEVRLRGVPFNRRPEDRAGAGITGASERIPALHLAVAYADVTGEGPGLPRYRLGEDVRPVGRGELGEGHYTDTLYRVCLWLGVRASVFGLQHPVTQHESVATASADTFNVFVLVLYPVF